MIDQIKNFALMLLAALSLLLGIWGGIVSYQFTKYKENINAQTARNTAAKARTEAEQRDKADESEAGYLGALDVLNKRLRDAETVPRCRSVSVAGSGGAGGTVSGETTDTGDPQIALAAGRGVCSADFYAKAMREHVQCKALQQLCQ